MLDALSVRETANRLHQIAVPTLVLAGGQDICNPSRYGRAVADGIPEARFDVLADEAHQPFQEIPHEFNARVGAFMRDLDG